MNGKEPELKFPVRCALRIIFEGDEAPVLAAAQMILARYRMPEVWEPGRASSGGKYRTLGATVTMPDRATLEALPKELAEIPGVRMVL